MAVQDKDKLVSLEDLKTAYDDLDGGISGVRNTLSHKADVIYDTASGDIASFPDGADGLPVKDLTVAIEPVQDLHGYANPWPAGGGKNKLSMTLNVIKANAPGYSWNGNVATVNGGQFTVYEQGGFVTQIKISGTFTAVANLRLTNTGDLGYNGLKVSGGVTNGSVFAYDDTVGSSTSTGNVIPDNYHNYRIVVQAQARNYGDGIVVGPMLIDSTETDITYQPYSNICPISGWTGCNISHSGADTSDPTVIPISWQSSAGTVYGGTLDVTTDVLTSEWKKAKIGDLEWTTQGGNYGRFVAFVSDGAYNANLVLCESDVYQSYSDNSKPAYTTGVYIGYAGSPTNSTLIKVYDTEYPTAEDLASWKAARANNEILYKLATPLVYQLDSHTIETLLGQNNIWSDTGDSTVEYPCDTKLYIDKKLAALVAALS